MNNNSTLLQINETLNIGSTGRIASQIGDRAMSLGWNSVIAYGREGKDCASKVIKLGTKGSILWHVAQTRLFDRHGLESKAATRQLICEIEQVKPSIIHLHNIHGYFLNYELLFRYLSTANTPIIWTLHDCWPITGHCSFFEGIGCDKWRFGCGRCPYLKDYPRSFLVDRSKKNFLQKKKAFTSPDNLTIVPVSEWLGELVRQSFLGKYPVKVIHNGTDINVFTPQESSLRKKYEIDHETIVLGVASVWHERKGLNDFVKLSEDDKIKVILVGVTADVKKRLPNSIIAINRTNSQKELAELYSGADVFVNPTYDDNFPTTNIESLACGTPVITYRTGGSPEAIDEKTGWVVEKGNIDGLKRIILNIGEENGDKIISRRKLCRERAVMYYNKEDRFQDYIELYKELLNEK